MFTGIIEKTARVTELAGRARAAVISVENPWPAASGRLPRPGESISVNGACLTVISANDAKISFDVSGETLSRTNLSAARAGESVNLERALRLGDDISGHLVSGHVDAVGRVAGIEREGEFATLAVRVPEALLVYLVPKGSVAVDGISLTIARLEGDSFEAAVIPETLARTTLGRRRAGDAVNIEADMLGKYVVRYLALMSGKGEPGAPGGQAGPGGPGAQASNITMKRLEELGY